MTLKVTFYTGSGRQPHLTELTIRYKYLRARIMARKYGVTGPQIKGPIAVRMAVRARTVYSTTVNLIAQSWANSQTNLQYRSSTHQY